MTEYDYSPEAYQRYLKTQERIGKWVDKTEGCRTQFANPFNPPVTHMPGYEDPTVSRRSSRRRASHNNSRSPSPGSGDEAVYGRGPYAPGPMLPMRSAPGHLSNFPKHQLPFNQGGSPLPSPPIMSPTRDMPPSYYGTPSIQQVKAHRRTQPRHFAPPPPLVLSPPVSPGVYGQPSPGYVMVSPGMARPMPVMSPPLPNSAPAHITTFAIPAPTPPGTPPVGYFQVQQHHPQSFASFGPPAHAPMHSGPVPVYAYSSSDSSAGVAPPHSAFPEMYGFTPLVSPQPGQAYVVSPGGAIPQVAVASPTTPATSPYGYVYPSTALHQRVFEMTGHNRHSMRRSVG